MGRARQDIVQDNSLLHVTFRCHDRQFYFESNFIKNIVYKTLLKYKKFYPIKIFDWVIMSNHAHLLLFTPDRESLSKYLHSTNLAIAKAVNQYFGKRGQAIEDRYKSPVIENHSYTLNTVGYIWLNPLRAKMVNHSSIREYKFSSLFYKLQGLGDPLVDDYSDLEEIFGVDVTDGKSIQRFAREFLQELLNKDLPFSPDLFENLHSVGSEEFWRSRRPILRLSG